MKRHRLAGPHLPLQAVDVVATLLPLAALEPALAHPRRALGAMP